MGFCGCSLYYSTITAGVLGITQSIIYLCLCVAVCIDHFSPFSSIYDGDLKTNHFYETSNLHRIHTAIKVMIVPTIIFNIAWFISSILLLSGNGKSKRNPSRILQWVIVTALMTTYEMLCTFHFLIIAIDSFDSVEYKEYFFLDLATISKGFGIFFGWSFNIPLAVYSYRQYKVVMKSGIKKNIETAMELSRVQPDAQTFDTQPLYPRPFPNEPIVPGVNLPPQWSQSAPINNNNYNL